MRKSSLGRRSSTNPVRVSMLFKDEKSLTRTDQRKGKDEPKQSMLSTENSHIPRARFRSSSASRVSSRPSTFKGKPSLAQYVPTTPVTPVSTMQYPSGTSCGRIASGLPLGRRSPSAERASNIGIKGPRKDSRPLNDKIYQSQMLQKIDNYFHVLQRSTMLNSNGSLRPITLKIFVETSDFLLKLLGVKQNITINNYVEELPKVAKKLHYPGMMNKSWLKTANAMHSWPNVLGWLCWLVEVCQVKDIAMQKFSLENFPFIDTDGQAEMHRTTFFSMLQMYKAWNDEKLEEEAAILNEYLEKVEAQQGITENDTQRAKKELGINMNKLEDIENESRKVDERVEKTRDELAYLQNLYTQMLKGKSAKEYSIKQTTKDTEQIIAECNSLSKQIDLQSGQHKKLLAVIKQQPMSVKERNDILQKCAEIESYMHQFDDHLKEIQKELYTLDIKLASINNNIHKEVLAYNKDIFLNFSIEMGIDVEKLVMPEKGMGNPDIMEILEEKANLLSEIEKHFKNQLAEKLKIIESSSNELEILQERFKALQEQNEEIVVKLSEKKAHMKKVKAEAKEELSKLREQIKVLQNDVKKLQESMPDMQKVYNEISELEDKRDAVRRRKEHFERTGKEFFDQMQKILTEHRNELVYMLEESKKEISRITKMNI